MARRLLLALLFSWGRCVAVGVLQAWSPEFASGGSLLWPLCPEEGWPRPSLPSAGTVLLQGAGGRHMMAQRLRRRAPWKRRAACTCLQRAQPTLLSSSLKSSRMCQLYLAEHST